MQKNFDHSMTIEEAHETSGATIRGVFIHYFTRIEVLMDCIIRNTAFESEDTYYKYMDILAPNMNMKTKLKLFKFCVEKYQNENGGNFSAMLQKLETIIDIRNKLAHWMLDTSQEGIDLYKKDYTFRFVKSKRDSPPIVYTEQMLDNSKKDIDAIQEQILKIHIATNSGL